MVLKRWRWLRALAACAALIPIEGLSADERLDEGLVNPGFHEQPSWFKNSFLDLADDVSEASAEKKRLVLFFFQDGCPYCKKLLEVNFAQKAIADKARQSFQVVAINMWGDREVTDLDGEAVSEKRFAEKMRVMFTPTLLFFDEQGKVALRINGYYPPHKFETALDYVAGHHEHESGFRDYYAKLAPPAAAGKLHTEPFIKTGPLDLSKPRSGRHRLVLFEQKECPACDELHGDVFKRKETLELARRFDVVQLDMWSKEPVTLPDGRHISAAQWAKELEIKYAPSMVFLNDQGHEVFRAEAYLKSFHIQSALDYVSSNAYRKQPSFQRFVEERADRLRAKGVTIDLMK